MSVTRRMISALVATLISLPMVQRAPDGMAVSLCGLPGVQLTIPLGDNRADGDAGGGGDTPTHWSKFCHACDLRKRRHGVRPGADGP